MLICCWCTTAPIDAKENQPSIETTDDVVVQVFPNRTLYADIARSKGTRRKRPLIICIHGGGWNGGDRKSMREQIINFARAGYVAAAVEYRLANEAGFPAQVTDVIDSINFIIRNARDYGVDRDKVALFGGSAGGHIALLVTVLQDETVCRTEGITRLTKMTKLTKPISATVSWAGPTDLSGDFPPHLQQLIESLFPKEDRIDKQKLYCDKQTASPINYLDSGDPAILIVHGTNDDIVPISQANTFLAAARAAHAQVEFVPIIGAGHTGGGQPVELQAALLKIMLFFKSHLGS